MPTVRYIKISKVPESAYFECDSQDIDALRDYVPNGKNLSAAFVVEVDGDYVTIYALYNGQTVPYLDRFVRVVHVDSYLNSKYKARSARKKAM